MTFNQPSWGEIYSKVQHGVVQVVTRHGKSGSGFVVSGGGHVITNAHVVANAKGRVRYGETVTVRFLDNIDVDGVILDIGQDNVDLACLQVIRNPLQVPLALGNSDLVRVTDPVIAVGYPAQGKPLDTSTVTQGILSAKHPGELQTDADINPGNSGGPLIDQQGKVIGVNTKKVAWTPDGVPVAGIGFAIAANVVKQQFPFIARAIQPPEATEPDNPAPARPETSGDGTPGHIIFGERFSITNLPRGWELSSGSTRNFARIQSGDSSLFLHLVEAGDNLQTVADINRQSVQVRAYTWAFGEVSRQLSQGKHQSKQSFHFEYRGDYQDGNGVFKGRYDFSYLECGGRRYILRAILVTGEDSPDDKAGLGLVVGTFLRRLKPV